MHKPPATGTYTMCNVNTGDRINEDLPSSARKQIFSGLKIDKSPAETCDAG